VAHYFAKGVTGADGVEQRCPSLLPSILAELAVLRKKAKKAMAAAEARAQAATERAEAASEGEAAEAARKEAARALEEAALYNNEQLSMKVVMNSVYGFTAADTLRLLALSETITYLGRMALADSIKIANETCAEMGFPASDVVYGDTDSIFVHVAGASKAEALDVGSVVSARCNAHFERATKSKNLVLEFEALFDGLILIGKKCYAGSQYAVVETGERATRTYNGAEYALDVCALGPKPKQYKKGMRAVRRDTPPFVARAQGESIDLLLKTQDVPRVLAYIQKQVDDLLAFRVPRADFQLTMQLKREDSYKKAPEDDVAKQPHLRLVKKLERRSKEGKLPQACTLWGVGERVPYFYAETEELLACDRAECPAYGEAHDVPYDRAHYFRLLEGALAQGLGVVPEVKAYIDAEKATRVRDIAKKVEQRRKDAETRRNLPAGQRTILGFTTTGATKRESSVAAAAAPPASKRAKSGNISKFLA
jgi:DNA polymerase elongation subunit (family B)